MFDLKYCQAHGYSAPIEIDYDGNEYHAVPQFWDGQLEYSECYFPVCTFGEFWFSNDWEIELVEPSDEELAEMDANADSLRIQMEELV